MRRLWYPLGYNIRPIRLHAIACESVARYGGRLGVVVENLRTGESASLNADQHFKAASLYKLWVLYSAFARMQAGGLSGADTVAMTPRALANEAYADWPVGTAEFLEHLWRFSKADDEEIEVDLLLHAAHHFHHAERIERVAKGMRRRELRPDFPGTDHEF